LTAYEKLPPDEEEDEDDAIRVGEMNRPFGTGNRGQNAFMVLKKVEGSATIVVLKTTNWKLQIFTVERQKCDQLQPCILYSTTHKENYSHGMLMMVSENFFWLLAGEKKNSVAPKTLATVGLRVRGALLLPFFHHHDVLHFQERMVQ